MRSAAHVQNVVHFPLNNSKVSFRTPPEHLGKLYRKLTGILLQIAFQSSGC